MLLIFNKHSSLLVYFSSATWFSYIYNKKLKIQNFTGAAVIIKITSNEPWNTQNGLKFTNQKLFEVNFCFLRGPNLEDVGRVSLLFPTYLGRSKETLFAEYSILLLFSLMTKAHAESSRHWSFCLITLFTKRSGQNTESVFCPLPFSKSVILHALRAKTPVPAWFRCF